MNVQPGPRIPAFPRRSTSRTEKWLAWLDWHAGELTLEDGQVLPATTYAELRELVCELNLLVLLAQRMDVLPLPDILKGGDKILCQPASRDCDGNKIPAKVTGVEIRNGRKRNYIICSIVWMLDGPDQLSELRLFFDDIGVGVKPTPTSLSVELAHKTLFPRAVSKRQWMRPPPQIAWWDFHDNLIGGRSENFVPPDQVFEKGYEHDQHSAYAAPLRMVPAGRCVKLLFALSTYHQWHCKTAWLHIRFTPPEGLELPFLHCKKDGQQYHPTEGEHETWVWMHEFETAISLGYELKVLGGWGFTECFDLFTPWLRLLQRLKLGGGWRGSVAKQMIVGLIGRFLQGREQWEVTDQVPADLWDQAETVAVKQGKIGEDFWVLYCVPRWGTYKREQLIHVGAWCLHGCWDALWAKAVIEARAGHLLAYNTDAVYSSRRPPGVRDRKRIGQWGYRKLANFYFPAKRWVVGDNIEKTPGQPHQEKLIGLL